MKIESATLFPILQEEIEFLADFGQLSLKEESSFIWYCKGLGVDAWHGENGEVASSWRDGWLRADRILLLDDSDRAQHRSRQSENLALHPLMETWEESKFRRHREYHPFRVLVVHRLNEVFDLRISKRAYTSDWFKSKAAIEASDQISGFLSSEEFARAVDRWNGIVDLSILLEPLYWSEMVGSIRGRAMIEAQNGTEPYADQLLGHRERMQTILKEVDETEIEELHDWLRWQADLLDGNSELYLLLRASNWSQREKIEGNLGLALWIRHLAELIRRGAQEFKAMELPPEDMGKGLWRTGARKWLYGDENPLKDIDAIREMTRKTLPRWGLHAAPRVRIYVEGDTEAGLFKASMDRVLGYSVELINMKSVGWKDRLERDLRNDVEAHRFSILVLDGDVVDTVRCIQSYAKQDLIVGMVFVQSPDVEFENFTVEQLFGAVSNFESAQYGERATSFDPLNVADFRHCKSGKEFETTYNRLRLANGLKGEKWGECLADVLWKNYSEESSKLMRAIICSIRAIDVDYETQKNTYRVDPYTLKNKKTEFTAFGTENSSEENP
jgi:hypothetical protein